MMRDSHHQHQQLYTVLVARLNALWCCAVRLHHTHTHTLLLLLLLLLARLLSSDTTPCVPPTHTNNSTVRQSTSHTPQSRQCTDIGRASNLSRHSCSGWMSANWLKLNVDKTEFVWTGGERNLQSLRNYGKTLTLGTDTTEVYLVQCSPKICDWRST